MYAGTLNLPDLDIPFEALGLELEDLPTLDELLRIPAVLSPPLTVNQTLFSERICIRINRGVLAELKRRAAEKGMRYQTFINMLLAQQASPFVAVV